MNQKDLVRALVRDRPFPDRPRRVRLVQTHMSYVFLTHRFVYKIESLDFSFADFSTTALERRFV
jgi:aminoglycoside phosphotransferase family enzyme